MLEPIFQKTRLFEVTLRECDAIQNMKRAHYHNGYEIYLQLAGERRLIFGDREYTLTKGSLFVIEPFVLHMATSSENPYFKRYLVSISPSAISDVLTKTEAEGLFRRLHSCTLRLDDARLETAYYYLKQIQEYFLRGTRTSKKFMQMLVALFVDMIISTAENNPEFALIDNGKTVQSPIYSAVSYVNSNYEHEISLDFISRYVHISKANFCLVFKKTMGDTFVGYLNSVRLAHAHKLILSTDLTLNEIALKTGFSSANYMSRTFKKIHGVSPSELKKDYLNLDK